LEKYSAPSQKQYHLLGTLWALLLEKHMFVLGLLGRILFYFILFYFLAVAG